MDYSEFLFTPIRMIEQPWNYSVIPDMSALWDPDDVLAFADKQRLAAISTETEYLDALQMDICLRGQLEPVIAVIIGNRIVLREGHHRLLVLKRLGQLVKITFKIK